jgi:hypothetical protein
MKNALESVQCGRHLCRRLRLTLLPHKTWVIYGLAELTISQGLCPLVLYT